MAVAFAGVLGLAAAERVSQRAAPWVWGSVLAAGMLAIMLNFAAGLVAPWAVVQFGGMGSCCGRLRSARRAARALAFAGRC